MATELKEGQNVKVVDREATANDEKSGLFYNYFRNVTGVLEKIYEDGKATVVVDTDTLPEAVRERHKALTETAKKKWLDGLSNEARSRLTPDEQEFNMRYTILVELKDLQKSAGNAAPVSVRAAKSEKPDEPKVSAKAKQEEHQPKIVNTKDLDKAEEEHLKAKSKKK